MQEIVQKQLEALESELQERITMAQSSHLPVSKYMLLAGDDNVDVRYELASNANIPGMVLESLSEDENSTVAAKARETLEAIDKGEIEAQRSIFHFGQAALE